MLVRTVVVSPCNIATRGIHSLILHCHTQHIRYKNTVLAYQQLHGYIFIRKCANFFFQGLFLLAIKKLRFHLKKLSWNCMWGYIFNFHNFFHYKVFNVIVSNNLAIKLYKQKQNYFVIYSESHVRLFLRLKLVKI